MNSDHAELGIPPNDFVVYHPRKPGTDDQVPAFIETEVSTKEFRKNWMRLIQEIYNVYPILCPKCLGAMRILSFIKDCEIIKKILK